MFGFFIFIFLLALAGALVVYFGAPLLEWAKRKYNEGRDNLDEKVNPKENKENEI